MDTPLVLEVEFAVAEFDDDGAVVVHFAGDDLLAQFVENEALQSTFDRTGTKLRVVSLAGDIVDSVVGYTQVHTIGEQHLVYRSNLQAHNITYLLFIKRLEHDNLVNTIQELGTDSLAQHLHNLISGGVLVDTFLLVLTDELASEVGGEDNQGILEINRPPFVVGQTPVVQYLQEDIEYIGVRFLYLVKEHYAVRFAPEVHR